MGKFTKVSDNPDILIPYKGERGEQGPPGKDGKDGRPGRDGKNGKDGKNGRDGKDGITPPSVDLDKVAKEVEDTLKPQIITTLKAELGKLPAGGGAGFHPGDLPGFKESSPNTFFGVDSNRRLGFHTVAGSGIVDSVNGKTGTVVITASDIGVEAGATADQTAGEIEAIVSHDALQDYVLAEHIDWTQDQGATDIHAGNIPDLSSTYLTPTGVGSDLTLARIGASTYSTVQHLQDIFHSSGWVSGGAISDNADGSVSVAAGTGLIRATDSAVAEIKYFDWAADATVSLTDNSINYVYARYNAGTPDIAVSTSRPADFQTNVVLGAVFRIGTVVHIYSQEKDLVGDHAKEMLRFNRAIMPFARETGAIISETGTRNIALTAGTFWSGLTQFTTNAFDSAVADTFTYYYRNGVGGWTSVATQTAINNTQYDDGSGSLATLTAARYGVHWVYLENDSHVGVVYGRGDYLLAAAQAALPPSSIPTILSTTAKLVGKIVIQKSSATFFSVESPFSSQFNAAGVTDHGDLAGLSDNDHPQYLLVSDAGALATQDTVDLTTDTTASGAVTIAAGGTDQNVTLTPSGVGKTILNGNVGINTAAPQTKLEVAGAAGITSFTGTSDLGVFLSGATSQNDFSGIDFKTTAQTVPLARIAAVFTGSGSKLSLGTSNSYGSGITNQAMTINPSGNVGIGTDTPTSTGGATSFLHIAATGGGQKSSLVLQNAFNSWEIFSNAQGHIQLLTNGSHKFLLDANSNFGVGVSAVGTSSVRVVGVGTGTAPTTQPANMFQLYSADITAGNAAPHFMTEGGAVIKLYQQANIVDADGSLADITTKFNTLLSTLENLGLLAAA